METMPEVFFRDPSVRSSILGLDYNCNYRSAIVLQVLSSGFAIVKNKFEKYSEQTAKVFVCTHPSYFKPSSVV